MQLDGIDHCYGESPPSYAEAVGLEEFDIGEDYRRLSLAPRDALEPFGDEVICHMRLLKAFEILLEEVENTKGLYESGMSETEVKERRWICFVSRAVDRYKKWFLNGIRYKMDEGNSSKSDIGKEEDKNCTFSPKEMPPLDILMVWHAHMMHPWAYTDDCSRLGRMKLWNMSFPWQAINEIIDRQFLYNADWATKEFFSLYTPVAWNSLDEKFRRKHITCYFCSNGGAAPFDCPRTKDIDFVNPNFNMVCPNCDSRTTHDSLRLVQFRRDISAFQDKSVYLPGTVLDPITGDLGNTKNTNFHPHFNELMLKGSVLKRLSSCHDFTSAKQLVKKQIQSTYRFNSHKKTEATSSSDRVFACYEHDSLPFSIDLDAAIVRQAEFAKNVSNNWLYEPSVKQLVDDMVTGYQEAFKEGKSVNQNFMDIKLQLVWHTHHLSPSKYYTYSMNEIGNFMDNTAL